MLFALAKTFHVFRARIVAPETVRLFLAAAIIMGAGLAASYIGIPGYQATRLFAGLKLVEASLACLIVAWPVLMLTGAITANERRTLIASIFTPGSSSCCPRGPKPQIPQPHERFFRRCVPTSFFDLCTDCAETSQRLAADNAPFRCNRRTSLDWRAMRDFPWCGEIHKHRRSCHNRARHLAECSIWAFRTPGTEDRFGKSV